MSTSSTSQSQNSKQNQKQNQKQNHNHNQNQKAPKKPAIHNKEGFSRASFLYQASRSLACTNEPLSRMYSKTMDSVTKRSVLKLDPSIKRTLCKKCHRLQIVGKTSKLNVENTNKPTEMYKVMCKCGGIKRYPVGKDRNYVLFSSKDNSDERP